MNRFELDEAHRKMVRYREISDAVGAFHATTLTVTAVVHRDQKILPEADDFPQIVKDYLRTYYRDRLTTLAAELKEFGVDVDA